MLINFGYILIGLVLLYYGGDYLITGSVRVAKNFQVSPFIIGATVIGFGTSAPELAVSILAAAEGSPELAMGNVIGSNIANVGLVLGLTAFYIPLTIAKQRFQRETPALLIATFLIMGLAWNFHLSRLEGTVMVLLLVIYLCNAFRKKEEAEIEIEEEVTFWADKGLGFQFLLILGGLAALIWGADFLVDGGVNIATGIGISEWFIGISIVAVGTSLPEIMSALIAARRGHGEMAIGNVFGSNIFNILMVLGTTAVVQPLQIREPIHSDLVITTALTCLLLVLIWIEHKLSKKDGFFLLVCYFAFIILKGLEVI